MRGVSPLSSLASGDRRAHVERHPFLVALDLRELRQRDLGDEPDPRDLMRPYPGNPTA